MFYKHLHDPSCDLFMHGEEAPQSEEAQLQAALDAERANRLAMEACVDRDVKAIKDLKAQLATLQAQAKQLDRTLADVYQQRDGLQAQLRQVEGERAKWEDIAGLRFAGDHKFVKEMELLKVENTTLRQLVEAHAKQLTELTIIPIGCSREQELRWTQSIKDLRATLAAKDAGKAVSSG